MIRIITPQICLLASCLAASFLIHDSYGFAILGPRRHAGATMVHNNHNLFNQNVGSKRTSHVTTTVMVVEAVSKSSSSGDQPSSSSSSSLPNEKQRRKKKNKYAKFSNADKLDLDPLEALLEESKDKLSQLEQEQMDLKKREGKQQKWNNHDGVIHVEDAVMTPPKNINFPDAKTIGFDPYNPMTFGFVEIGKILGPHGVHGWVKVKGCTDFPERLTHSGMLLHVKPLNKRAPRRVTLASGKMLQMDSFLIQLQDCYSRGDAEALKGATLYYATQQDELSKHDDDEFLVSDLVGLQVYLQEKKDHFVGTVQAIVLAEEMCSIPGLGHDMLEVVVPANVSNNIREGEDTNPQTVKIPDSLVLIPLVPEIVPKVDLIESRIFIDPPTGLLDLTYVREEKVRIKALLAPCAEEE